MFPAGKGSQCVGLTTLPLSCADCLEIWEPQPPGTLRACPGPYRDGFTSFYLTDQWPAAQTKIITFHIFKQFYMFLVLYIFRYLLQYTQCTNFGLQHKFASSSTWYIWLPTVNTNLFYVCAWCYWYDSLNRKIIGCVYENHLPPELEGGIYQGKWP